MRFGSLFTGVGGFDLGFERAGMNCAWQCEIDPKASAVLARHWPGVTRYEDVRTIGKHNLEPVDLICGGFPCQDLSVAGKRAGLAGSRSGLWFEFHRILSELKPQWVVIENVPGLLSSNGGRDFAVILRGLGDIGYLSAWRVLDAQFFGVAQRRRRVFVIASLGDGRAATVLFERESLPWHTPPRRETGQGFAADVAPSIAASGRGVERTGESRGQDPVVVAALTGSPYADNESQESRLIPFGGNNTAGPIDIATACNAHGGTGRHDFESETFIAFNARRTEVGAIENLSPTLNPGGGGSQSPGVNTMVGVRRLTPLECERLQGFPDNFTDGQADSSRYRQMGNAVAVPVAEWIGRRIMEAGA